MNVDKQKELYKDFPDLYIQRSDDCTRTCMCWGFECGDGWYDLIYDLSKEIQDTTNASGLQQPEAVQVKQKYGGLCFYVDKATKEVYDVIDKYENKSYKVCEVCGEPGVLRQGGWMMTLCNKCDDDYRGY